MKRTADSFLQLNREAPNVRYVKVEGAPPGPLISAITAGFVGYGGLQLIDDCSVAPSASSRSRASRTTTRTS
jgi:hypothetical protein